MLRNICSAIMVIFLINLAQSVPPWSYVPSRWFAAYQFILSPSGSSSYFSSTVNQDSLFNCALMDIHDNVMSDGIILAGFQSMNALSVGFQTTISSRSFTEYILQLHITNSDTTIGQVGVYLILIGNEASGSLQLYSDLQTSLGLNGSPGDNYTQVTSSSVFTQTSTITSGPVSAYYFLHSFQIYQGTSIPTTVPDYVVTIQDAGCTSPTFCYKLQTTGDNALSQVGYLIFFYSLPPSPAANIFWFFKSHSSFYDNLNNATSVGPDYYDMGSNRKCMIGERTLTFPHSGFTLEYDASLNVSAIIFVNVTDFPINLTIFCMVQYYDCSLIDNNCQQCQSHTQCILCADPFFANNTFSCQNCNVPLAGCTQCINSSTCLLCDNPTYFFDVPNGICLNCTQYLSHCLNCTNILSCTVCQYGFGLQNVTGCQICQLMITNCSQCINNASCQACFPGFFLLGPTTCAACSAIPNCNVCSNSSFCSSCSSDFYLGSDNYTCFCNPGLYSVNSFCSCLGCISAQKFNNITYCLACDTSNYMQLVNNTCVCILGFSLQNSNCIEICGDSRVIYAQCDDGNLFSNDGCSSTCQTEYNYQCANGTINSRSVCVYIGPIILTLQNILKVQGKNQVQILISISPVLSKLSKMNFSNYFSMIISNNGPGNIHFNSSISYDQNGNIQILAEYNTSLEGEQVSFALAYNPIYVNQSPSTLSFQMKGSNQPIIINNSNNLESMISNLGYVIVGVYLLQLLLSIVFHKMIGLETIQIVQIVFFIRYIDPKSSPLAIYNINSLKYINFYNPFSNYPNVRMLSGNLIRLGLSKSFILNTMIHIGLIIIGWVIYKLVKRYLKKLQMIPITQKGTTQYALEKRFVFLTRMLSNYVFILSMFSLYLFFFSYLSNSQSANELIYQLPPEMIALTLLVILYSGLYTNFQMYANWRSSNHYDEVEGFYYRYVSYFLAYYLTIGLLMIGGSTFIYGKEIIAAVVLIYTIFLIKYCPYYLNSHNVFLIINQIAVLIFVGFLILLNYISFSDAIANYIVIGYEGLLILVGVLALIRIYIHQRYNDKAFKKMRQDKEKAKGENEKNKFMKVDNNKQLDNSGKHAKKKVFRKERNKSEQEDQLIKLKNRLKKQYIDQNLVGNQIEQENG